MADKELEKLKSHFDAVIAKNREEMLADNAEIKLEVKQTNDSIIKLERTMDNRVKELEIINARREGAESVNKPILVNWTKVILAVTGVASAAIGLALLLAQSITRTSI